MIYGYCRVSTKKQMIDRQIKNIKTAYPDAQLYLEHYTGTTTDRPVFQRLLKRLKEGDTLVFDSVSRMSRDADEGYSLYQELYDKNIRLIFLKEPLIDTDVYRDALHDKIPKTGTDVDLILDGINLYLQSLTRRQIKIAFDQSEHEVKDLHKRTSEGIAIAKAKGKQIGRIEGKKYDSKKYMEAKEIILKRARPFASDEARLSDKEVMKLTGVTPKTFYIYKKRLHEELLQSSDEDTIHGQLRIINENMDVIQEK